MHIVNRPVIAGQRRSFSRKAKENIAFEDPERLPYRPGRSRSRLIAKMAARKKCLRAQRRFLPAASSQGINISARTRLLIQTGSAHVWLGTQERDVHAGAIVFIPSDTWISLKNTGNETINLAFVFSDPGFDEFMRCTSVPA